MGKYSRDKGKRGELDAVHKLGGSAKRVGHSYIATPVDIETSWAVFQVRNRTIGGSEMASELGRLRAVVPGRNCYVLFKVRGKWYAVEMLEQLKGDHGDAGLEMRDETGDTSTKARATRNQERT